MASAAASKRRPAPGVMLLKIFVRPCRFAEGTIDVVMKAGNVPAMATEKAHAFHGDPEGDEGVGSRRHAQRGVDDGDDQVQRGTGEGRCAPGRRWAAAEQRWRAHPLRR